MNPILIALSGPVAGQTFPLGAEVLTAGRDRTSSIHLRDLAVSRHHCVFATVDARPVLRDLESRYGSFVNGVAVSERTLEHGDLVAIGESLFLVQTRSEPTAEDQGSIILDDRNFVAESTIQLSAAPPFQAELAALPPEARVARDLQALVRIGAALQSARSPEELARRLLALALAAVPGERAALVLTDRGEEDGDVFTLDRAGGSAGRSRCRARSSARSWRSGSHCSPTSPRRPPTRASRPVLLAAPLIRLDRPVGVLYVDSAAGALRRRPPGAGRRGGRDGRGAARHGAADRVAGRGEPPSGGVLRPRPDRREPAHAGGLPVAAPGGRLRRHRPHPRRERHRQGAGRPRHPRSEPAGRAAVRGRQLRRAPRDPARERALRPRARRLHRRRGAQDRQVRGGRRAARCSSTRSARSRSALQAKLLRVLQEREFERVGEHRARSASTSGSSPPPTATSRRRSARGPSARTSTTG